MSAPKFSNGYEEDPIFQKSNYMQDISEQMRVPKRIKATGEYYDDLDHLPNVNGSNWNYDKIDMTVPDRIVVMGQDQHLGTRSAPREIILDNSILPSNQGSYVRVSTPPRVITLSDHHFPSASDEPQISPDDQEREEQTYVQTFMDERRIVTSSKRLQNSEFLLNQSGISRDELQISPDDQEREEQTYVQTFMDERRIVTSSKRLQNSEFLLNQSSREATPPLGEGLSPTEELLHLRRQVAKLNRRMLSIELDTMQRQQREKIIYSIGLAYFLIKAFMWLNRN